MTRGFLSAVFLFTGTARVWAQGSAGAAEPFKPAPPAIPLTDQALEPAKTSTPMLPLPESAPPAPSGTLPVASQVYPPPPAPVVYPYPPYPALHHPHAPGPPVPGRHQHDGFFLRMNFGLGASAFRTDYPGSTAEISGSGIDFAIALGGAVTRHLVLFGEICEAGTFNNSNLTVNGNNRDASYGDVIFVSVGAGAAYYFGEGNYVLSGALSLARLTFEGFDIESGQGSTDRGPSFRALFGKEWWVSSNWGMGVALALTFSSVKDKHLEAASANGDTATWSTGAISLLYSATYN